MTTHHDAPQTFGADSRDEGRFGGEWRGGAYLEEYQPDPGYPYQPEAGYEPDAGYDPDARYEIGAGYDPDARYESGAGYEAEAGYARGSGYASYSGYPPGYAPEVGHSYAPGWSSATALEPLPDPPLSPYAPDDGLWPEEGAGSEYGAQAADSLLDGIRPAAGWRRNIYRASGGLVRFGKSAAVMRHRDLISRIRTPVAGGHHRIAVLSLKGGVGKTTTVVGLGATLAAFRGDRVIAVDANPDRGTLSDKVRLETAATIRDLLNERGQVRRYPDIRAFTSQTPSRLEVLASDRDPAVSVAFGADDYCDAARMLEQFYSICITDCGTGLLHSAMFGVLELADQIVLVSSPSVDGARSASATLDWLEAHRYGSLVRNGVVVLSAIRRKSKSTVDLDRLEHHFAARCRAVVRVPHDAHLEEGAEIDLDLLGEQTAEAYLDLAALVGDGLAWPRRLTYRSALP